MILECEAREPHSPAGRLRRENDCRLFIQRTRSKRGSYNVTEVTEIAWQLHPHLKFDILVACKQAHIWEHTREPQRANSKAKWSFRECDILVPRGRAPFGQHQESRPLAKSNTGSPRFTDFPSLCACSESSLTNLIGSGLNLLCLQSHSKTECRWTRPEVAILGADQKERGLWGREWECEKVSLLGSL